jgi:hypothetical protein
MDYLVCENNDLEAMQRRVNEYIRQGWLPIGGVAIVRERVSGPVSYFQAVIKNGSEPPPIKRKRGRPPKIRVAP